MKKRLCALILCVAALLGTLPVLAAEGSLGNFVSVRTYDGRFADVEKDAWYYDNIAYLYDLGLAEGQAADAFGVSANITIGEALSFAARVRSTYYLGDPEAGAGGFDSGSGPWYGPYIQYLTASGVAAAAEFSGRYDAYATRSQMAAILMRYYALME